MEGFPIGGIRIHDGIINKDVVMVNSVYREPADCSANDIIITPKQLTYTEQLEQERLLKEQQRAFYLERHERSVKKDKIIEAISAPIVFVIFGVICMSPVWIPYCLTYWDIHITFEHCVPLRHVVCE